MSADTIELVKILAEERPDLAEVLGRPGTKVVMLAGSKDPNAKITLVLLDEYGPAFVIKAPTNREAERVVRNEGYALEALAALPLGPLGLTLPRAVGHMSLEGRSVLVSTAVGGQPMAVKYHAWRHTARRRHVRADFAAAGLWLGEMQSRTAKSSAQVTLVSDALDRITSRHRAHPNLDLAKRALAGPQSRLANHATPRTVVHGDFWYGNILVGPNGSVTGVVDWESCQTYGEPLCDVARFVTSYALYLDRHTRAGRRVRGHRDVRAGVFGAGMVRMLEGRNWLSSITQNYLTLALGRLGLPPHLWRDVIIGGIADVAATADHPEFAESHLELLARLAPPDSITARAPSSRIPVWAQPDEDELATGPDLEVATTTSGDDAASIFGSAEDAIASVMPDDVRPASSEPNPEMPQAASSDTVPPDMATSDVAA